MKSAPKITPLTTFATLPDKRAAAAPHAPAVSDDTLDLDNTAFLDAVDRFATGLESAGVAPGDVVAIRLPNTAHLVVGLFAAWRLGAAATPINPFLTGEETAFQIRDSGAKVVLTGDGGPEVDQVETISPEQLLATSPSHHEPVSTPTGVALLIYTSGTTGKPKGVILDHSNLIAMSEMSSAAFDLGPQDHSLLILPLFHVNAIVVSALNPLARGGRVSITARFDPRTFFDAVERTGATFFSAVPTIYTMLADLPADAVPDTSSIRFGVCGAAPASKELLARFESRYGFPLVEGYGLSECTCAATCNPLDGVRKPGTVGLPLTGQQIRIVKDGIDCAPNTPGEVLLAGPNIMRGYLNRPEETAKTIIDGWLHTGDIGFIDDDGYLTLVDRAKDMIIRGGENIYPKEIETVVHQLPGVAEAAVIGQPDAKYGEVPALFVSTSPDSDVNEQTILRHTATHLAKYKQPTSVTFLDSLPKNPVGKVDKPALRRSHLGVPNGFHPAVPS